jgi:hypothetical protein
MLLLILLFGADVFASSTTLLPCATPALLMDGRNVSFLAAAAPPEDGQKTIRNSYANMANQLESDNFVLWWGNSANPAIDTEEAADLLNSFELAWFSEIDTLGFSAPESTASYKFNVYLGDTGGPSSLGANGYYFYDDDDWPMIVIAPELLGTETGFVTAAHEFFHAIQDSTGAYVYADDAAWYFEATAVWSEAKVYPGNTEYVRFIPSLGFLPHLPINFFEYPDSLDLEEYHHYGASLFIKHLEEVYGSDLIHASWQENSSDNDPLEVLKTLLEAQGSTLETAFFDFFDRNGTWDYPDSSAIKEALEASGGYDDADSERPTGKLRIPVQTLAHTNKAPPFSYGGNYWQVLDPPDSFNVSFSPLSTGVLWHVSVMAERDEVHSVEAFTIEQGEVLTFSGYHEVDTLWLGIAAITQQNQFASYSLTLSDNTTDIDETASPKICGCTSATYTGTWPLLFLLSLQRRRSCAFGENMRLN